MKALMTLGLVCGFTVLTGADALAKPGKGATSTVKTEKYSGESIERGIYRDFNLTVTGQPYSADPTLVEVYIEAEFRTNMSDVDFCWTQDTWLDTPCLDNKVDVTDGDANMHFGGFMSDWYGPVEIDTQLFQTVGLWQASLAPHYGIFEEGGLEVIECGVDYKFKIANGNGVLNFVYPHYETETVNFPCPVDDSDDSDDSTDNDTIDDQEDDEEEIIVEECTECPFGGTFDGTGCYVGTAPNGWSASISGNYFSFGSYSVNSQFSDSTNASGDSISNICLNGTRDGSTGTLLRDGSCGLYTIPTDVDAFTDNNGWYYDPVCE